MDDTWNRGIEEKLLCLKELSREQVRKGLVFFMNLKMKTKNVGCRQAKTRFRNFEIDKNFLLIME